MTNPTKNVTQVQLSPNQEHIYYLHHRLHSRNHLCKTQLAKGCTIDPHTLLIQYVQSPESAGFTPACLSTYENTVN